MGKIEEGLDILIKAGLPRAQQNERSSLTLLAVLDIKQDTPWVQAKRESYAYTIYLFLSRRVIRKNMLKTPEKQSEGKLFINSSRLGLLREILMTNHADK